jgi:squalene-hopene cyclase-like protein/prenyltransferase/squalene oxidase-like repeat protein
MNVRVGLAGALAAGLLLVSYPANPLADERAAALFRACSWLASQQRPDGSISFRSPRLNPNVWETANALIALLRCGPAADRATIDNGFRFLDANWTREGGLPESSWRLSSPDKGYCVETTGTGIRAYKAAGKLSQARKLRDFLFSVQEPDGGWKIGYPEAKTFPNGAVLEVYPSVTGFALAGATAVPVKRPNVDRGLAWLAARQNPGGDWGAFSDYFGIPYYATAQIVTAFMAEGRRDDPVVARAVRFTLQHQHGDGSWGESADPLTPSQELWTALALLTLQAAGDRGDRGAVQRGVAYLLRRQQPDGRWIGGFFKSEIVADSEKKEDVYTTSLVIVVLAQTS